MIVKGSKQKNYAIQSFISLLFYAVMLLLGTSCSQQTNHNPVKAKQKEFLAPATTLLSTLPEKDKPKVIYLNTVPNPSVKNILVKNTIVPSNEVVVQQNSSANDTSSTATINEAKGNGFFTTYTTDDGLCLDQVYCSYKDKWGNLWFGTNGGGVSKYDGKNFTTYTTAHGLANNVVWCIMQDHEDNLWFGTDGSGVSKYDGETFTNYDTAQGLPDNVIFSIAEDKKNNLWFGTLRGGVSKWNGKNFTNYSTNDGLTNNAVKTILEDSKGNFWFGTLGGGVSKWDGKNFTTYTMKEGLSGNRVWSVAEDNSGSLWFATDGKGLSKHNGNILTNYQALSKSSKDEVLCITKDRQGNLWCGTKNNGVIKYDGRRFTKYSTTNGLANNQIRAVTEDEKGNLWFGSFGSGICKFAGNSFTNFTTYQGLAGNVIFSIEEDKESNLWFGTSGGGASKYDGKRFTNFTAAHGLAGNEIYCILKDREGNLWFGTSGGGVSKYNGKAFTTYTTLQGLANNIIFSIAEDKTGNLWFGTSGGGVSKYDGKSFTNYTTLQGLAGDVVFSITEDKNANLWFGTLGNGVSKFDGTSFKNYTVEQGLSDNVVWAITEDRQGNLWFGTQQGLSLMPHEKVRQTAGKVNAGKQDGEPLFIAFTTGDGLPNNFITQIMQGEGDTLYVGTNLGMCELQAIKSKNVAATTWSVGHIFNTQNGYPVKDVNAGLNAMFKDSKGIIWIATGSDKTGLVRFEPDALSSNSNLSPRVFINQVKINNEVVSWRNIQAKTDKPNMPAIVTEEVITYGKRLTGVERDSIRRRFSNVNFSGISKWQPLPQELILPYYFNNVSFSFGVIETGKNFLVNYKYFLEGYDKEWSPASRNTYINYGNINEGNYTFKAMAQSPEGVWGQPVSYTFTVLPPWWRTWWVIAVYAILTIASIYLFVKWNHRQIIFQKKILEHKVAVATKQVREENAKVQMQKNKIEDTFKELKAIQSQLIQSEKMASLGELTAGIAHEIRNPLNFVNNFSEVNKEMIAEMKVEIDKGNYAEVNLIANDIKDNEEKINYHGKRADAIVKSMLQHSRSSTGQKEPTDINALAEEYLRLSYNAIKSKDKNFKSILHTNLQTDIAKIEVVPQDIGRVFLNLYNNAFYSVQQKKSQLGDAYEPTISVSTVNVDGKIVLRIKDNGNGIPSPVTEKIFQPFFTTKPTGQGTGLGLSLSYDTIKAHGGSIKVDTKEGEYAEFTIELPVNQN